jgi:hypothetical protein
MCSLFVSSGYLAVGGQRSELVVRELHGNWAVTTTTGGSINNGVTVAETNGEKRLMVSNNDETIKVFSIPSMHLIDNLCLPTAVNGGKSKKKIISPVLFPNKHLFVFPHHSSAYLLTFVSF